MSKMVDKTSRGFIEYADYELSQADTIEEYLYDIEHIETREGFLTNMGRI